MRSDQFEWRYVESYADTPAIPGATLVHLAEERDIGVAEARGDEFVEQSTGLVKVLLAGNYKRVVYASSAAVYANGGSVPLTPGCAVSTARVYARAKLACEELVREAGGVVLRIANLYGPGMAENNVISDVVKQVNSARGEILLRDLTPVRDFLWVGDAAVAVADAAEGKPIGVFNVSSGQGTSVAELARMILDVLGATDLDVRARAEKGNESTLVLDPSATTEAFGWRPQMSLRAGLERMLCRET